MCHCDGFLTRHITEFRVILGEDKDCIRVVGVIGLALKPDAVILQQALTCFAPLCEAKRSTNSEIRLVQYAFAHPFRVARCSRCGSLGNETLALLLALIYASFLAGLFPLGNRCETDVLWKNPLDREGETIEFVFRHLAVGGNLLDGLVQKR